MDRIVGPRLKIERANKHVADLQTRLKEFIASDPYTHFPEDDPKTGDLVYRIAVEPHAAEGLRDLALIVGDVVHNLRSALDLLACQLVGANSGQPHEDSAFTVWRSERAFLVGGAGRMIGAHPDAIRVMRHLKPYKGGNDRLWRLHRLDATDKHRLLLTIGAHQSDIVFFHSLFGDVRPQRIKAKGPTVLLEDRAEIFRIPRVAREYFDQQPKPEFFLFVALSETEIAPGLDIIPTLRDLASLTTEICDLFEPFLL